MSYCFDCNIFATQELSRVDVIEKPDKHFIDDYGRQHYHTGSYTNIIWQCPNGHIFSTRHRLMCRICGYPANNM